MKTLMNLRVASLTANNEKLILGKFFLFDFNKSNACIEK